MAQIVSVVASTHNPRIFWNRDQAAPDDMDDALRDLRRDATDLLADAPSPTHRRRRQRPSRQFLLRQSADVRGRHRPGGRGAVLVRERRSCRCRATTRRSIKPSRSICCATASRAGIQFSQVHELHDRSRLHRAALVRAAGSGSADRADHDQRLRLSRCRPIALVRTSASSSSARSRLGRAKSASP